MAGVLVETAKDYSNGGPSRRKSESLRQNKQVLPVFLIAKRDSPGSFTGRCSGAVVRVRYKRKDTIHLVTSGLAELNASNMEDYAVFFLRRSYSEKRKTKEKKWKHLTSGKVESDDQRLIIIPAEKSRRLNDYRHFLVKAMTPEERSRTSLVCKIVEGTCDSFEVKTCPLIYSQDVRMYELHLEDRVVTTFSELMEKPNLYPYGSVILEEGSATCMVLGVLHFEGEKISPLFFDPSQLYVGSITSKSSLGEDTGDRNSERFSSQGSNLFSQVEVQDLGKEGGSATSSKSSSSEDQTNRENHPDAFSPERMLDQSKPADKMDGLEVSTDIKNRDLNTVFIPKKPIPSGNGKNPVNSGAGARPDKNKTPLKSDDPKPKDKGSATSSESRTSEDQTNRENHPDAFSPERMLDQSKPTDKMDGLEVSTDIKNRHVNTVAIPEKPIPSGNGKNPVNSGAGARPDKNKTPLKSEDPKPKDKETQRSAFATPPSSANNVERQYYYTLFNLLTEGGTTALRNAFHRFYPQHNLADDLRKLHERLRMLHKKRVLNRQQWDQLFPVGCKPDSNMFDITLLFLLLINFCGLRCPPQGWHKKPPPTDTSFEANLVRIKCFRNMLSHTTDTCISESDYFAIREELRAALKGLGFDEGELDRLETDSCLTYDEEFMNLKKRVDKLEQKVNQANVPTQERQRTFICGGNQASREATPGSSDRSEGQRVLTAYNIRDCEEFDVHLTSFSSDTKAEVNIEKCRKFKLIDPPKFS